MTSLTTLRTLFATTTVLALAGCGGGSSPPPPPPAPAAPPVVVDNSGVRGSLIRNPPDQVLSLDTTGLASQAALFGTYGTRLSALAGAARCGVDVHRFEYATVGAAGEPTTASGALMVPTGTDPGCTGGRPIVMYAHGSTEWRNTNLAELSPAAVYGDDSIALAELFAAQGYIVVASNYAGYDTSTLSYHPHHIADQQSKDMIDALSAARKSFASLLHPVTDNGKIYLTGHSEGGYVTMATARAMQQAGITLTAAAPSSGAYAEALNYESTLGTPGALADLSSFNADAILKEAMQFTAWQKADGDLYTSPDQLYPAAFATTMETLGPSNTLPDTLVATGQLPGFLLSNDEPDYAGLTAPEQQFYGTPANSLIKTAFLQAVRADVAANPCDVASTTEPLACAHPNTARKAWFHNDLRTWTPTMPMLMCGGNADPEVPFRNTQLTYAYYQNHGLAANLVSTLDVDSPATANDPWALAKATFLEAKQAVVAEGGNVTAFYHGTIVDPACLIAARDFFKAHS